LHTSTCPKFKRLRSHGPVEATWPPPDLFHLKLKGSSEQAGTLLTTTSSQKFYKMLLALKPMSSSKKPMQVQQFWVELLDLTSEQYHRALTSNSRVAFALLPKEKEVFTKLIRDGHQTGNKQGWWDPAMAKCKHCPAEAKDDIGHVFFGCVMFPAIYWARALEIFSEVLSLTEHCKPQQRTDTAQDIALCLLGLGTDGKLAPPCWLLFQRISIRAIWLFYTGHKYGDDIGPHLETQPLGLCKMAVNNTTKRIATEWNTHVWKSGTLTGQDSDRVAVTNFNTTWLPLMCIRTPIRKRRSKRWMAAYEPFYKGSAGNDLSKPTIMIHKSINVFLAAEIAS
jgi:hypothetical protein